MSENSSDSDRKSIGVRFANSAIGRPIVAGLLFVTSSFWLSLAAVGVLLILSALAMGDTVLSGIIATFGLSGVFVGLLGYVTYLLYARTRDTRAPGTQSRGRDAVNRSE